MTAVRYFASGCLAAIAGFFVTAYQHGQVTGWLLAIIALAVAASWARGYTDATT